MCFFKETYIYINLHLNFFLRFGFGGRVDSQKKVGEGAVEGNEAIYEGVGATVKRPVNAAYDNNTYFSVEQVKKL